MEHATALQNIFEQAIQIFPYPLMPTGFSYFPCEKYDHQGELEEARYGKSFMFVAGRLLDEPLIVKGWIELKKHREFVSVTALFFIRDEEWTSERVWPEETTIQGAYDLKQKSWTLYPGRHMV